MVKKHSPATVFHFFAFFSLITSASTWAASPDAPAKTTAAAENVEVAATFNNKPFHYTIRQTADRGRFTICRLEYPSPVVSPVPENNVVPADYYLPKNLQSGQKYPAVINLHILDGNESLTDLFCSMLARNGIPAISIKMPYYGARGGRRGPEMMLDHPALLFDAVAQTIADIRRTTDLLASRPEINPERVGICGISLGGIIGATAAAEEPRIYRAVLLLAGGDLPTVFKTHASDTRQLREMFEKAPPELRQVLEKKMAEADPLAHAAKLRDRAVAGRVLMLNATEDEVIPHVCTEKLAEALGISDRVAWMPKVGHTSSVANLPHALIVTVACFAQDMPTNLKPPKTPENKSPVEHFAGFLKQFVDILTTEPEPGCCHKIDVEFSQFASGHVRVFRGTHGKFIVRGVLPIVGEIAFGQGRFPWLIGGKDQNQTVFIGTKKPLDNENPLEFADQSACIKVNSALGIVGGVAQAPESLARWLDVKWQKAEATVADSKEKQTVGYGLNVQTLQGDGLLSPYALHLNFAADQTTPLSGSIDARSTDGSPAFSLVKLKFNSWQLNMPADDASFEPPKTAKREEVDPADLHHIFSAAFNFAARKADRARRSNVNLKEQGIKLVSRDPAGHGMICRSQGKTIMIVSGTPTEMGTAQGTMLRGAIPTLIERAAYVVGGGDTVHSGTWFFDRMAEIERRVGPFIPQRFVDECDAMAKAAGVSQRDGRIGNLFPERFHCSGVALKGKATAGGRVLHARVLDYMTSINLQDAAVLQLFLPKGRNAWLSVGYAGFIGTVTAMNEKGVAVGEIGGRGEGQWDGVPMSLLLRDIMERAATTEEALAILEKSPRTCEYHYVFSDRHGTIRAVECTPQKVYVLGPGEQDSRLPQVPEDTVFVSAPDRAKVLATRIEKQYGKIDVPTLINIIKRPVAMNSNLHDAIFTPETLDVWFADAGDATHACDAPYAHVNLAELRAFYEGNRNLQNAVTSK